MSSLLVSAGTGWPWLIEQRETDFGEKCIPLRLTSTIALRESMKRILFDTGNNPEILARNAKAKGVDLTKLDFVVMSHRQCGRRLVSKQAAVASVVFVDVQATLLDHLGGSSQCCCDGRIANVWQRLDENFLDFFQCKAVVKPGPHVDGEFMGLTHGNHDGHRN